MPVGVESDLDRQIAKALHDRSRVRSLLDQHGGTGVAQVVESKTIQSEGLDARFEDSPVEVGVPQNRSGGGGEDHLLSVPGYATGFEVSGKALTEEVGDRNRTIVIAIIMVLSFYPRAMS